MGRVLILGVLALLYASVADAQLYIRSGGLSQAWTCSLDNIGTTLTECQAAPGTGKQLYVTDIKAQSTTATAGQFLLRYGTGANCGTGTTSLLPSAATVVRLAAPANTAPPTDIHFLTPLAVPINNAICLLGVVTNTVTIQLSGFTTGF
jgi:hypothetical protein